MSIRREPRPVAIERLKPGKKLLVDCLRMRTRQCLVHMMMRIDEARQHDVAAGGECLVHRLRRFRAGGEELGDLATLDDESAARIVGETGQGITYPQAHEAHSC